MTLKDELDSYREGFKDGKQFVLDFIKQATKQEFEDVTDLIVWIREKESQNETE